MADYKRQKEAALSREEALKVRIPIREAMWGDRAFYSRVLLVALPMVIQNTLSQVVSLLDNVMVGRVGTLPMSAVAIVNQILFVYYLCVWGALAGAGIFGTQYFGKGDHEGVKNTVRFKLLTALVITSGTLLLLHFAGEWLIGRYIAEDTGAENLATTMSFAKQYLHIMMTGLVPFGLTQVLAGTLRESGKTTLPMVSSIVAMAVNFVFNLLLIFGYLGFPRLGVAGAAIATVLSRFVEMAVILVVIQRKKEKYGFLTGLFRPFHIDKKLAGPILSKTLPLFGNEFLWSFGQAFLLQCYSVRGLDVVAAMNITNTISNVFMEVFLSLGYATGVLVGQELGANRLVNARRTTWRLATLGILSSTVMGILLFSVSGFVPNIYNTEAPIRALATNLIRVIAIAMPIDSYANVAYFTLRSGGKTFVTFLFDACFVWVVSIPAAYILAHFTSLNVVVIFATVLLLGLLKCIIGAIMVKRGVWIRNIVSDL